MTDGTNLSEVRDEVFDRGVGYIAGDMFAPNGDGQNMARLCFAFESVEKNYEGPFEFKEKIICGTIKGNEEIDIPQLQSL